MVSHRDESRAGTVLIAGASGLVGTAAALAFLKSGYEVIALSRRPPELLAGCNHVHLPLDLRDPHACRAAAAELGRVTHVVYAAVHELPGLTAGWTAAIFIRFMAFRRIDYRSELWWSFSWSGDASRFLRVGLALAVMTSAIALDTLLSRVDLPCKSGEHQLRNQEVFYGKREQTDAGVSA